MNTLEQLSLEAFQLALSRLEEPLPEALAQQVQYFSENWEAHIGELRTLTEQFAPLKTQYLEARLELQSQSADRKQYIPNGFQTNSGGNGLQLSGGDAKPPSMIQVRSESPRLSSDPSHPQDSSPNTLPSIPFAQEKILKTLEKSHLTAQELIYTINQPPEYTEGILRKLWEKGYIDQLSTPLPYILFPSLRSSEYHNTFPSVDTLLTLTTKGYFHLYPLIKRNNRMVSA
jgi:hypothetical protein